MTKVLHVSKAKHVPYRKSKNAHGGIVERLECKCGSRTFFIERGYICIVERFVCSNCGQGYEWRE